MLKGRGDCGLAWAALSCSSRPILACDALTLRLTQLACAGQQIQSVTAPLLAKGLAEDFSELLRRLDGRAIPRMCWLQHCTPQHACWGLQTQTFVKRQLLVTGDQLQLGLCKV